MTNKTTGSNITIISKTDTKINYEVKEIMTNSDLLKARIKASGLTMEKIAKDIDISLWSLYNKVNGTSDFTVCEMLTLSEILNLKDKKAAFFCTCVSKTDTKITYKH